MPARQSTDIHRLNFILPQAQPTTFTPSALTEAYLGHKADKTLAAWVNALDDQELNNLARALVHDLLRLLGLSSWINTKPRYIADVIMRLRSASHLKSTNIATSTGIKAVKRKFDKARSLTEDPSNPIFPCAVVVSLNYIFFVICRNRATEAHLSGISSAAMSIRVLPSLIQAYENNPVEGSFWQARTFPAELRAFLPTPEPTKDEPYKSEDEDKIVILQGFDIDPALPMLTAADMDAVFLSFISGARVFEDQILTARVRTDFHRSQEDSDTEELQRLVDDFDTPDATILAFILKLDEGKLRVLEPAFRWQIASRIRQLDRTLANNIRSLEDKESFSKIETVPVTLNPHQNPFKYLTDLIEWALEHPGNPGVAEALKRALEIGKIATKWRHDHLHQEDLKDQPLREIRKHLRAMHNTLHNTLPDNAKVIDLTQQLMQALNQDEPDEAGSEEMEIASEHGSYQGNNGQGHLDWA